MMVFALAVRADALTPFGACITDVMMMDLANNRRDVVVSAAGAMDAKTTLLKGIPMEEATAFW